MQIGDIVRLKDNYDGNEARARDAGYLYIFEGPYIEDDTGEVIGLGAFRSLATGDVCAYFYERMETNHG